jgi:hypothetical protein
LEFQNESIEANVSENILISNPDAVADEAAHEKTDKDTDNSLVTAEPG